MKKVEVLKNGRVKVVTVNTEETMTQQHHKEQCDINNIIARARRGAAIGHVNPHQGRYEDLTAIPDYEGAMNAVVKANEMFMALPANVREEFGNSPQALIKFLQEPKNKEKAIELGLVNKPVLTPKPEPVEVIIKAGEVKA